VTANLKGFFLLQTRLRDNDVTLHENQTVRNQFTYSNIFQKEFYMCSDKMSIAKSSPKSHSRFDLLVQTS
jgi:hypothetical protein